MRMRILRHLFIVLFVCPSLLLSAKDYPAALFNIYGDGTTLNTRAIQFAIDYVHSQGGGRLVFDVGRYVTGSVELKSHVTLQLNEGAVLVGSLNPLNYIKKDWVALIFAYHTQDIGITGLGIIDGRGQYVARQVVSLVGKGLLKDPLRDGRPEATSRPVLINFHDCDSIRIRGITLRNSSSWVQVYDHCRHLSLERIHVDSKAYWNNDGIDLVDCQDVRVLQCYVDSDDDGICLKSFDKDHVSRDILIRDCVIRSSASAVKFGTSSYGGFEGIRITHNQVFDTYRSAIALEAVDGGFIRDVAVDSLDVVSAGNVLFLRIGERVAGKTGQLTHIRLSHVKAVIAAGKPDSGYAYEGPIGDMPRNVSPGIVIAGLPGSLISDVVLTGVQISHPGGANPLFAKVSLDSLALIPEHRDHYPEFSMFGELPAWGAYIRHAADIRFQNVKLSCRKMDYRAAVVLDDLQGGDFRGLQVIQPMSSKPIYLHDSQHIREN